MDYVIVHARSRMHRNFAGQARYLQDGFYYSGGGCRPSQSPAGHTGASTASGASRWGRPFQDPVASRRARWKPTARPYVVPTMAFADFTSLEALLSTERARTIERIAALTRDRQGLIDSAAGVGVDDEHDPEGATVAFERSQLEAFLDLSRRHLTDLDRALRQVRVGDYGICETCGEPIASERLAARPAAQACITCASRQ